MTLTGGAQVTGLFNIITSTSIGGTVFAAPIVDGTLPGATSTSPGAVTFTGAGTIFLAASNTYTGGTTLNTNVLISSNAASGPGTLNIAGGSLATGGGTVLGQAVASTGATIPNNVYLTGNVTFNGSAPLTFNQPVTLDSNGAALAVAPVALTVNNATTFLGQINELGTAHSLSLAGPGTVTLSATTNTFSGGITLGTGTLRSAGILVFPGSATPTTPLGSGLLTLNNGVLQPTAAITLANLVTINATTVSAPLTLTGGNITFTGPATLAGASTVANVLNVLNTTVFAAPISGTAALIPGGTGTLQLTAANTYTGVTTVLGGTMLLNNLGTAWAPPASP